MKKTPQEKLPAKIIALDLDDTLLNNKLTIGDKTVSAIQKAAAKGIYITICSGRTENGILPFVRRLDVAGTQAGRYIITGNGTGIFDLHKRVGIYSKILDSDIILCAYNEAEKMGLHSQVYDATTIYAPVDNKWARLDVELTKLNMKIVPDFTTLIQKGFSKIVIPGEPEVLLKLQKELKEKLGDKAVIFTSKPYFLEVLPANSGKGEALLHLAKELNIPQENTMAFGDSMNDESMIRLAKYGIAMCNGLEYIQQVAAYVTDKTNEEDGVGDFIEKYVL
ncbi:MAG: Cof-type HAD-IIB family hydrolase [Treponema sp.]